MADCKCGYRAGTRPTQIGCGAKDCPNVRDDDGFAETLRDIDKPDDQGRVQ